MKTVAMIILVVAFAAFAEDSNIHVWGSRTEYIPELVDSIPEGQFTGIYSGCSAEHIMAIDEAGTLRTWGEFDYGTGQTNVSYGTTSNTHSAYIEDSGKVCFSHQGYWSNYPSPFVSVAMGWNHEIALREDSTIRFDGEGGIEGIPEDLEDVLAVAAGCGHTLILFEDEVFEVGRYGDFYFDHIYGSYTAVAGGYRFSMALHTNGSIEVWGDPAWVPTEPIPGNNIGFVAIAAGKHHCVALRNNGDIEVWGDGEQNLEPELENVIGIAAGIGYSVAITEPVQSVENGDDGGAGDVVFNVASPFGPLAYIFAPQGSCVTVYDMTGRQVGQTQDHAWSAANAPAGVYIFVLGDGISSAMAVKL